MKSFLFSLLLLFAATTAKSQDVYTAVLISAQDVLDNPDSDEVLTKIAQFKITALNYTHRKMVERNPDTPAYELDVQAYYLSEFLTLFFADVRKHQYDPERTRKEAIMRFVNISVSCPLFNDPDKNITEVYIDDGDNLTPFSLDTDWQKACEMAKQEDK